MTSIVGPTESSHLRGSIANPVLPWWWIACTALLFVILGAICHGPNTLSIDLEVSQWIQGLASTWADPLSNFGNTIGEAPVAIGLLITSLIVGSILKRWQDIWFVLVVAIGRLSSVVFKGWFDSPRPAADHVNLQGAFDTYGFPSGHTLTSTIVAGTLVYLIARQFPKPQVIAILSGCWLLAIGSTAFARIWIGAHWLTDTLGGTLLGIFIILMAANLSALLVKRWPGTTSTVAP